MGNPGSYFTTRWRTRSVYAVLMRGWRSAVVQDVANEEWCGGGRTAKRCQVRLLSTKMIGTNMVCEMLILPLGFEISYATPSASLDFFQPADADSG
jgi:hypothetical protein